MRLARGMVASSALVLGCASADESSPAAGEVGGDATDAGWVDTRAPTVDSASAPDTNRDTSDGAIDAPSDVELDLERPVELAIGYLEHACARTASGHVRCWGDNSAGELGDGTTTDRPVPGPPLAGIDHVIRIAAGNSATCAIRDDHSVWCWGQGDYGLVGDGILPGPPVVSAPTRIPGIDDAEDIGMGGGFVVVRRRDHTVWSWGRGAHGVLGYSPTTPCSFETCSAAPRRIFALGEVARIAVGGEHACALKEDGTMWCWGGNGYGEQGDGTTVDRFTPQPVLDLDPVSDMALGGVQTCAITRATKAVHCWGGMEPGAAGITKPGLRIGFSGAVTSLSVGFWSSCAVVAGATIDCWWISAGGSPGAPKPLAFPAEPIETIASGGFACAIGSDHAIYCFGSPYYLGDGSFLASSPIPVKVAW